MLVRNHTIDIWDPKYDVAYCVVQVIGRQSELTDLSGKIHKVNVQDVKITWPVNEVIVFTS